jgi:hypothetical protein
MCQVYETVSIVGKETKVERHEVECPKKPPGSTRTVQQCPDYKFTPAGSSRKKKGLRAWASDKPGGKRYGYLWLGKLQNGTVSSDYGLT